MSRYTFRYSVQEHRATISDGTFGVCFELVGPKSAWYLRKLIRDINRLQCIEAAAREVVNATNARQWIENINALAAALNESETK